jgi:porphobilinogen deaminase
MTGMLRLGTRGSALALAQSGAIAATVISELRTQVELVTVQTEGDRNPAAIAQIGGTGVFVTALRDALVARQVDLAVHSFKDLPTAPAPGLVIAAVPVREDPRDVLVARDGLTLGELPTGSRSASVSTSSRSAATSTPASARCAPASWTASCWPAPACSGWTGSTRRPRCWTP